MLGTVFPARSRLQKRFDRVTCEVQLIAPLEYTNQMSIAVKEQQREDVENVPSRAKVVFVLIPVAACAILSLFVPGS